MLPDASAGVIELSYVQINSGVVVGWTDEGINTGAQELIAFQEVNDVRARTDEYDPRLSGLLNKAETVRIAICHIDADV